MVGMADRDFPKLPNHREVKFSKVDATVLRDLINKTFFSVSTDETRAHLNGAVVQERARVGEAAVVEDAVIGPRAQIGAGAHIASGAVVGPGVSIPVGAQVEAGERVFPEGARVAADGAR